MTEQLIALAREFAKHEITGARIIVPLRSMHILSAVVATEVPEAASAFSVRPDGTIDATVCGVPLTTRGSE